MRALPPTLRTMGQQLHGQSTASLTPSMPRKPAWARLWMLRMSPRTPWPPSQVCRKKRKEKTTPFGVNLLRSQVLYRPALDRCVFGTLCRCRKLHASVAYTAMHVLVCSLFQLLNPLVPSFMHVCIHSYMHRLVNPRMRPRIHAHVYSSSIAWLIHSFVHSIFIQSRQGWIRS